MLLGPEISKAMYACAVKPCIGVGVDILNTTSYATSAEEIFSFDFHREKYIGS